MSKSYNAESEYSDTIVLAIFASELLRIYLFAIFAANMSPLFIIFSTKPTWGIQGGAEVLVDDTLTVYGLADLYTDNLDAWED